MFSHVVTIGRKIKSIAEKSPVLTVALFLTTTGNMALWSEFFRLSTSSLTRTLLFSISLFLLISLLTGLLLHLVRFKYLLKPTLIAILLVSSVASYFMNHYGIMIDTTMMHNIAETDPNEVHDLLGTGLFWYILLLGILPSVFVYYLDIPYLSLPRQILKNASVIALSLLAIIINATLFYPDYTSLFRNHHHIRYLANPINYLYSASKYVGHSLLASDRTVTTIGMDAKLKPDHNKKHKKSVIVLVVGETARAQNFSLNGYPKNTNPELSKQDIINYPNVYSCGTSTHTSLPCMFSHFGRADFDESASPYFEKLPDVLKHAGLDVLWRDNNSGCKGVCNNIKTEILSHAHLNTLCNSSECYDEVLLDNLKNIIESKNSDAVIMLHQKGSHGPAYFLRHPADYRTFSPECMSNELTDCSQQEIMNAYDNTIVYTDHFLAHLISLLKEESDRYDTAMLYISDHGESLGEHNFYLHSLPYIIAPDEQKHVPFITWFSDDFLKDNHLNKSCLKNNAANSYSHDNLFHSMLGLTNVSTSIYNENLDIFRPCRTS